MFSRTLIFLAEFHLHVGLIGIDEFTERLEVAHWLDDNSVCPDPREPVAAESDEQFELEDSKNPRDDGGLSTLADNGSPRDDELEFIWSTWVFTRQDPDPYPSTPHGHLRDPNRSWPKLNPYVGRVFDGKHRENQKFRLNKKQMIALWSDQGFREFCRSHILWYTETFRLHKFGVMHTL